MKNPLKKLFVLFIEGFFILLPILITYLMIGQLFDMLMALTQPILDVLPASPFPDEFTERLTAAGLLIVICVLVGIAANTSTARRFGNWFESTVLNRFPPYTILKSLSSLIAGKDAEKLQPALLSVTPDSRMLVAIVEELPSGELTVFVPLAPTPGIGFLQIVKREKIQKLDSSMTDALGWFLNWGAGTDALFRGQNARNAGTEKTTEPS
jgi:uncharacterized membrane protein